jgi:hypothetical protein
MLPTALARQLWIHNSVLESLFLRFTVLQNAAKQLCDLILAMATSILPTNDTHLIFPIPKSRIKNSDNKSEHSLPLTLQSDSFHLIKAIANIFHW